MERRESTPRRIPVFRRIYLIKSRASKRQRSRFGVLIPNAEYRRRDLDLLGGEKGGGAKTKFLGTVVHVVGTPMTGYQLEFKRNFDANARPDNLQEVIPIGKIHSALVVDPASSEYVAEDVQRSPIETIAAKIPAPGRSENFMAPVNDETNRRCQEWTMDFVRLLVSRGYLDSSAIDLVQSHRDPPDFGIGIQSSGAKGSYFSV